MADYTLKVSRLDHRRTKDCRELTPITVDPTSSQSGGCRPMKVPRMHGHECHPLGGYASNFGRVSVWLRPRLPVTNGVDRKYVGEVLQHAGITEDPSSERGAAVGQRKRRNVGRLEPLKRRRDVPVNRDLSESVHHFSTGSRWQLQARGRDDLFEGNFGEVPECGDVTRGRQGEPVAKQHSEPPTQSHVIESDSTKHLLKGCEICQRLVDVEDHRVKRS